MFWLVTVPKTGAADATWESIRKRVSDVAGVTRFSVPSLKVGTFDQLISLSDELAKLDPHAEAILRKIERQHHELTSEAAGDGGKPAPLTGPEGLAPADYIRRFAWDRFRYPDRASIGEVRASVAAGAAQMDKELKEMAAAYMGLKQSLGAAERAASGTLAVKPLAPYVKEAGVKRTVVETEHLTTLFAVVPGHAANDWTTRYETLCDWVVPRSSVSIAKEGDLDLRTVVVFRQVARDFKRAARELRVTVRELSDDDRAVLGIAAVPEEGAAGEEGAKPAAAAGTEPPKDAPSGLSREEERASLADRVDEHWTRLVRWCTLTYQEALQGWMHVKAARAFVESVLRYGLPVNFEAVLVDPGKKGERKVRAVLDEMYGHLGQQDGGEDTGAVDAMAGIAGSDAFYAYVCLTIATSAEDAKTRS